jgi:acyl-CoA thioester hydrolase
MTEARDRADDDAFVHRIRVYWEDTDAGGIVFYANYLKFFERARTEWLRTLGVGQQRWREDSGLQFIVTETAVRYLRPARLDDLLEVNVRVTERQRVSLRLVQQAWCDRTLLAEGDIRIACVHSGTFAPRRIPNEIMDRVQ